MHKIPLKKQKNFQALLDPKKQILKVFILIKTQPLNKYSVEFNFNCFLKLMQITLQVQIAFYLA